MLASCTFVAALLGLFQDAKAAPDPLRAARTFEQSLGTHPYFSRVGVERNESHAPYFFLVQRTGKDEGSSVLVERYAGMLDPALGLFEREIATPLGLARRGDQRLVVAVLPSPGDMENYARVVRAPGHFEGQGLFDAWLNAAVLYEDPFHVMRNVVQQSLSVRHAILHACEQAWSAPGVNVPIDHWALEALACELSRRDPDAPDTPLAPDATDLGTFLLELQDEAKRWAVGRTLEELCTIATPQNLPDFFAEHPAPAGLPAPDLDVAGPSFYREATLYLHFLLEGEERRYRAGALAWLKQVLAGHADFASCAQCFAPTSAAELDAAFVAWALDAARASDARSGIDAGLVTRALLRGAATSSAAPSSPSPSHSAPASAPSAPVAPASSTTPPLSADLASPPPSTATAAPPPTLAPLPILVPGLATDLAHGSEDQRFAFALYELGRGRTQSGLAVLEALERANPGLHERIERERRRVAAWIELRDAFLRERVETKELLEFTYKGNKLKTEVLGYADGRLNLEKARAPEFLGPDAIDPLELAQQMKASGTASDWPRLYPYVLQDDPRGRKLLKDDGAESSALLADARNDYPPRLRLGALAGRLQEFATRKPPASAAEARKQFEALAAWRKDAEGSPLLEEKREAVRAHARTLLLATLEGRAPKDFLHGKLVLPKQGDNVRLIYEFDDAHELEDFVDDGYPQRTKKALSPETAADVPFHVDKGELVGQGQTSLRNLVDLAAPMTVRYTLEYREVPAKAPSFTFALGLCDDGQEHFLWAVNLVHLQRFDLRGNDYAQGKDDGLFFGRTYALELRHDGTTLRLLCDGKETQTIPVGQRASGGFFLCASSDCPVHIQRLELEGHLQPNGLDRLKDAWIERDLADF